MAPSPDASPFDTRSILDAVQHPRSAAHVVRDARGALGVSLASEAPHGAIGTLPPVHPEWLGDRTFNEVHGVRFPYCTGAMANGIAANYGNALGLSNDLLVTQANAYDVVFSSLDETLGDRQPEPSAAVLAAC